MFLADGTTPEPSEPELLSGEAAASLRVVCERHAQLKLPTANVTRDWRFRCDRQTWSHYL